MILTFVGVVGLIFFVSWIIFGIACDIFDYTNPFICKYLGWHRADDTNVKIDDVNLDLHSCCKCCGKKIVLKRYTSNWVEEKDG